MISLWQRFDPIFFFLQKSILHIFSLFFCSNSAFDERTFGRYFRHVLPFFKTVFTFISWFCKRSYPNLLFNLLISYRNVWPYHTVHFEVIFYIYFVHHCFCINSSSSIINRGFHKYTIMAILPFVYSHIFAVFFFILIVLY